MDIRRRPFIASGMTLLAAPGAMFAQTTEKVWRIGFISLTSGPGELTEVFREALRNLGYVEGRNVLIEYRWAAGKNERVSEMAAELVRLKVDVIVGIFNSTVLAAMQATKTIPIVFPYGSDPIGMGMVASLARPGGNVTGLSQMAPEMSPKRVELLHTLVPSAKRMAVLWNPSSAGMVQRVRDTRVAAEQLRIAFFDAGSRDLNELQVSFAEISKQRTDVLLVTAEPFTGRHRDLILEFCVSNRIPAMYEDSSWVNAGGLISYGPNLPDMFRRSATYVDKILKGAKPSDLPVEQPMRFDMVINLKTAKALGLTVPYTIRLQATEMIE